MCGIAGILTPGTAIDRECLTRMVAVMAHRGPDGEHQWFGDDVALGVRRLAIVDVAGGSQPLTDESGTVHVVYNGEIYNHEALRRDLRRRGHRLSSRTDGAVIPHLYEEYGPRLLSRLEGMFAIAIWDERSRTLLLARDPRGIKPLYVFRRGPELRFASEIKALLVDPAVPRQLDPVALDHQLTFRFTPAPRTLLRGVEKLEPGSVLAWRDGVVSEDRYLRTGLPPRSALRFEEAAVELRGRLRTAVHSHMMSDRPIGAMLSGGVDSGAVVALMSERSSRVSTFTVGFEGGGDADETALARQTAALFDTDHHELIVGSADFARQLPEVLELLEEPVATSSAAGFLAVARLAQEHVPVLLSGQGADELLGGYWRYLGEWLAGAAARLAPIGRLASTASRFARSARIERGLRALAHTGARDRFMDIYAVFTAAQKRDLYREELAAELVAGSAAECVERLRSQVHGRNPLEQMMYVDLRLWLPDDLLLVGDKMTMAASVEMRVPFLDSSLVEFAESLPGPYKLRRGQRKAVEKAALAPLLPREIIHRKERGFVTPIQAWLRSGMLPYARDLLLAPDARCAGLFKRSAIEQLLSRHQEERFDHARQIFCLLSFEVWARRFLPSH